MNEKSPVPQNDQNESTPTPWDSLLSEPSFEEKSVPFETSPETVPVSLPTISPNKTCNFYLSEINRRGALPAIKSYLESAESRDYTDFSGDPSTLADFANQYAGKLAKTLNETSEETLRQYSGYDYKYINQVARDQWDYDLLGAKTEEKLRSTEQTISDLSDIISSAPPLGENLKTYRGTNLRSFLGYNVHSVEDLAHLKNQFFVESGFTSTTLDESISFANHDLDDPLRSACNVAIEYSIPAEATEVIGLFSETTTYSPGQREVLIDQGSLSFITDVEVSPETNTAKLKMTLIPRDLYDPRPEN